MTGHVHHMVLCLLVVCATSLLSCGDDARAPEHGAHDGTVAATSTIAAAVDFTTPTVTATVPRAAASASPTPSPPRHVTFAPGETVETKQGVYFVDPTSAAVEGWEFPDTPPLVIEAWTVSSRGRYIIHGWYDQRGQTQERVLYDTHTGAFGPAPGLGPARFSPDERWYLTRIDGGSAVLVRAESGAIERTMPGSDWPWTYVDGAWAPDSTKLLLWFAERTAPGTATPSPRYRLLRIDLDSGAVKERTVQVLQAASWSPDGQQYLIVTATTLEAYNARDDRLLWRLTASDLHLPDSTQNATGSFVTLSGWSADRTRLALQYRGILDSQRTEVLRFYLVDARDGHIQWWAENVLVCGPHVWSADGAWLHLLGVWQGEFGSLLITPDGRTIHRLARYVEDLSPVDPRTAGIRGQVINVPDGTVRFTIRFTGVPGWDFVHDPLWLADGRMVVHAPHGGHGGCAMGPPLPELTIGRP